MIHVVTDVLERPTGWLDVEAQSFFKEGVGLSSACMRIPRGVISAQGWILAEGHEGDAIAAGAREVDLDW